MKKSKSYNRKLFTESFPMNFIYKPKRKPSTKPKMLKDLPPGNWILIAKHDETFLNTVV